MNVHISPLGTDAVSFHNAVAIAVKNGIPHEDCMTDLLCSKNTTIDVKKFLKAETDDGTMVGFFGYSTTFLDFKADGIFYAMVDPQYQRQGVGTALMNAVLRILKETEGSKTILLYSQSPAYFESFGFQTTYTTNEGTAIMILES
jgi:N-acetylglutamate synthase-like GNAT family acetyltransferase